MILFTAIPLHKYSSSHKLSIPSLFGFKTSIPPHLSIAFNFNFQMSPQDLPDVQLTINLRESDSRPDEEADFCIHHLTRWRLPITHCETFEDYLQALKSNHLRNYRKTQRAYEKYGATLSFIEGDWSEHAETVYQLYLNVAKRHGSQLYDLIFFRLIATRAEYKLICAWRQNKLISVLIVVDEKPVYHSMLCGFDYEHSKHIYAYSLLHYELIRIAITATQYTIVEAGITANKAKSMMNFSPVISCMDVRAKNIVLKTMLRFFSYFFSTTINEQGKLKLKFAFPSST